MWGVMRREGGVEVLEGLYLLSILRKGYEICHCNIEVSFFEDRCYIKRM